MGAEGRKEVKLDFFEAQDIPVPHKDVQQAIVDHWRTAQRVVDAARDGLTEPVRSLNSRLIDLYQSTCTRDVIHSRFFVLDFQDFTAWDVKSGRAASFRLACPSFRPMGDFIQEATDLVRPADEPEKDWPVYGVNNKEGVFLNSHKKGAMFNSPYKRIRKDWFFHNPTRCNVGSLGIVPEVPADAITSPEYQVWRLKTGHPGADAPCLCRLPDPDVLLPRPCSVQPRWRRETAHVHRESDAGPHPIPTGTRAAALRRRPRPGPYQLPLQGPVSTPRAKKSKP